MVDKNKLKQLVESSRKKCELKGVRFTQKRADVLAILIAAERPLSAYEILDHYNAVHSPAMPAMSAYRILDFLMSVDLVHKLESQSKYLPCMHLQCAHQHAPPQFLVCQTCGVAKERGSRVSWLRLKSVLPRRLQAGQYTSRTKLHLHACQK